MKYEIKIQEPENTENTLPEVGQFWRHAGSPTVYMRIRDSEGDKCFPVLSVNYHKSFFYSVTVGSGVFVHTNRSAENIQKLAPASGVFEFKVV